jgi:rhodanese-related sulfurtransferase
MARKIDRDEAQARIAAGAALLDAQGPGKFERQHIPGAIRGRIDDPDTTTALLGDNLDREIVVYCTDQACTGSALAAKLLEARGYSNILLYTNGLSDWAGAGLPVDTSDLPLD